MLYKNLCLLVVLFRFGYSVPILGGEDVGEAQRGPDDEYVVTGQNKYPFMAYLYIIKKAILKGNRQEVSSNCGGVIISNDAVLTAAHCFTNSFSKPRVYVQVRLVDIDFEYLKTPGSWAEDYSINKGFIEKQELSRDSIIYALNDIAIVWLETPLVYGPTIQQAVLAEVDEIPIGVTGLILGWGDDDLGISPGILQQAETRVISTEECKNVYRHLVFSPNTFCALSDCKTVTSSEGDSGGPFLLNGKVYGLSSFGFTDGSNCDPTKPEIFTHVGKYRTWIHKSLEDRRKAKLSSSCMKRFPSKQEEMHPYKKKKTSTTKI